MPNQSIQKPVTKRPLRAVPKKKPRPVSSVLSKSVGAIVVNPRNHVLLVFQQKNRYWEFPKGKVEKGEKELETLKRELFEETGIRRYTLVGDFRRSMYYDFQFEGKIIRRKVVYYLISTNDRVRISAEHTRYAWLSIPRAKKRLKHKNQIEMLDEVMHKINAEKNRTK